MKEKENFHKKKLYDLRDALILEYAHRDDRHERVLRLPSRQKFEQTLTRSRERPLNRNSQ